MKLKSEGFTFVEIVIVIVLLGVLSALALPKFADLSGKAYENQNKKFRGNFKSGIDMAHALWFIEDLNGPGDVQYNESATGVDLGLNTQGWPVGQNGTTTLTTNTQCAYIWDVMLEEATSEVGYTATRSGTDCIFAGPGTYTFTYHTANGKVS